jgi:hypothetical protein
VTGGRIASLDEATRPAVIIVAGQVLHVRRLMRSLPVVIVDEGIELGLLLQEVLPRRFGFVNDMKRNEELCFFVSKAMGRIKAIERAQVAHNCRSGNL